MENNEKLDWKPEVGKTAWYNYHDGSKGNEIREVIVDREENVLGSTSFSVYSKKYGMSWDYVGLGEIFPTPEAALASIKIYDLEGKEVLIPRARSIFEGDDLHRFLRDEAGQSEDVIRGWDIPHVKQIPMRTIEEQNVMLSPDGESYLIDKQEYFDWCLRNEDMLCMFLDSKIRGGAAIGGKSDQREGGY